MISLYFCGGIPLHIRDGYNGFLVENEEEAAARIVTLLRDAGLRREIDSSAKETLKQNFLMSRLLEQYFDLLGNFEANFRLGGRS